MEKQFSKLTWRLTTRFHAGSPITAALPAMLAATFAKMGPLSQGKNKQISTFYVIKLFPYLPWYILTKFNFILKFLHHL
jgi:hypothetical protein